MSACWEGEGEGLCGTFIVLSMLRYITAVPMYSSLVKYERYVMK